MSDPECLIVRRYLMSNGSGEPPSAVLAALREHLVQGFVDEGLAASPADNGALDRWTRLAFTVIETLARDPFATQAAVARDLSLDRDTLIRLNAAIATSDVAQALVTQHGRGAKYWQNTILPMVGTGLVRAVRQKAHRYPLRVGVYPGVSCMFFCTFCGRQHDAKYPSHAVPDGNALFSAMLRDAPGGEPHRFYVSGGLEPLTNPGLGDLVAAGAEQGAKLSLYTNGFMLTPQLLQKQDGLWRLHTLRISMYGVDRESTARVTRHPKSFDLVVRNAKEALRLRNLMGSPLRLGFNFVVLRGQAADVLRLADLIGEINREAGGDRQIDFLTLREDYSVPPTEGLSPTERTRLIEIFGELERRRERDDLRQLQIDYGYALQALSDGAPGQPLEMVSDAEMRPSGYPQISVVVDLLGDVYLYREAGFLDRPGARRYSIGRITPSSSLDEVVRDFVESGRTIVPEPGDTRFFDAFDHVVTKLLNQADADEAFGIPFELGPVRQRAVLDPDHALTIAHPTLPPTRVVHSTAAGLDR
jgi:dTDP-4-amino-4,6-dideoxy-D-glucose ammonia-lyase